MSVTAVNTIISDIKVLGDYNVTDTDLDSLIIRTLNYGIRRVRNWMLQYGIFEDTTVSSSFKTIAGQNYVNVNKAHIVGNVAAFTGIANDKLKVTIDGTAYDDIDISACTTIALVVTAINAAVASTVAEEDDDGYLQINSLTTGSTSAVTVADGTTSGQTVVGDLFSTAAERTQTALYDLDDIIKVVYRSDNRDLEYIPYSDLVRIYPDPSSNKGNPEYISRFNGYFYFGPTPGSAIILYYDYMKALTAVVAGGNMPFDSIYDELIVAIALEWLYSFLDSKDRTSILTAKERVLELKKNLIIDSPKRIGMDYQLKSRHEVMGLEIAPQFKE